MKCFLLSFLFLSLGINIAQAEEFVDKRFYERFNPKADGLSWFQVTPNSFIDDASFSYLHPEYDANIKEYECKLLENKINYIKMQCLDHPYQETVELWIFGKDKFYPCALEVKFRGFGRGAYFWIPDGSGKTSNYDQSKPYSQFNNNSYKDCLEKPGHGYKHQYPR